MVFKKAKWHYSEQTGKPEKCTAKDGKCRYRHFNSEKDAYAYMEELNADKLYNTYSNKIINTYSIPVVSYIKLSDEEIEYFRNFINEKYSVEMENWQEEREYPFYRDRYFNETKALLTPLKRIAIETYIDKHSAVIINKIWRGEDVTNVSEENLIEYFNHASNLKLAMKKLSSTKPELLYRGTFNKNILMSQLKSKVSKLKPGGCN